MAIGLQIAFEQVLHGAVWVTLFVQLIAVPLVNVVVLVNVGTDAAATREASKARIERILERAWAIILIDVALSITSVIAVQSMGSGNALERFEGVLVLFMQTMLIYAEPYAALEDGGSMLAIIPLALFRSMMLSWVNMLRICVMFALQLAVIAVGYLLVLWMHGAQAGNMDYAGIAYGTITSAVLAAIFAVAYLDTLAQERERVP